MIHDLYLYSDLFGESDLVSKSFSNEFNYPTKPSSLHLELKGEIPGYFYSSWHYPDKERKLIISGDKGSFIWVNDDLYFDNTYYQGDKTITGDRVKIPSTPKSNLELELEFFTLNKRPNITILGLWKLINKIL